MRKNDDSDGTSPARACAEKKTKSPGSKLASGTTPHFSLCLKPGACHPISHRKLARKPDDLNREGGSSAAMVDWRWSQVGKKAKGMGEQGAKETCARWKENESCESVRWIPPSGYPP
jgi:hypothetical protein